MIEISGRVGRCSNISLTQSQTCNSNIRIVIVAWIKIKENREMWWIETQSFPFVKHSPCPREVHHTTMFFTHHLDAVVFIYCLTFTCEKKLNQLSLPNLNQIFSFVFFTCISLQDNENFRLNWGGAMKIFWPILGKK